MPIEETIADTKAHVHRTRTERIEKSLTDILEGENVDQIINKLSESEQELFQELVKKIRTGDISGFDQLDELWRVDYIRRPPTIQEFIDDEYWAGNIFKPSEENTGLYPTWREMLIRDFDLDSRVHNCVITGSLGTGKTYVMIGGIFLYRIVLARLLRNPQNFFGLSRGSRIFYAILSLSREVVRDTAFGDMMNFMSNSPFFLEECQFDPDKKYTDNRIPLGNNLYINAGSKGWHVIGRNVMGVCLDEGNYRLEANPDEKAYELYDEVRTRIQNRFQKIAGYLPAISILASSARDESSFTEKVIKDIDDANDPSTQIVYRNSVYKIKRHLLKLKDRWFKVAYGLKNIDPSILSGWYTEDGKPMGEEVFEEPPAGSQTELVPEDYHDAFVRNCRIALQGIAGISTGGSHRLFQSLINLERAIELAEKDGLKNPSMTDFLPISQEDDKNIWDYLEHPRFLTRRHSQIIPLRHPDELRYAHLDLATVSMAGLAICHRVGRQLITDVRDGEPFQEFRLVVEYDFILTIIAGRHRPISLEKIQRFFFWLRDFCGFRFALITADQFQSTLPLEMLQTRDFNTKLLSLDRNAGPYHSWRSGFEDTRIRMYRQPQLLREAEKLIDADGKVSHPNPGSKDTCMSLNTKVLLLSGQTRTIGDIQRGEEVYVITIQPDTLKLGFAKAVGSGVTRQQATTVKIYLDNDEVVTCTPDHKIMLRDGTWKMAEFLKPGDSLMPFDITVGARLKVYDPSRNHKRFMFHVVDEQVNGTKPPGVSVHHKDRNKRNDCPGNLQRLTGAEHWAEHLHITLEDGQKVEDMRLKKLKEYNARPETKEFLKRVWKKVHEDVRQGRIKINRSSQGRALVRLNKSSSRRKHHSDCISKHWQLGTYETVVWTSPRKLKITQDWVDKINDLCNQKISAKDVAKFFDMSYGTFMAHVAVARRRGHHINRFNPGTKSIDWHQKRQEKVNKLKQLVSGGLSIPQASKKLDVSTKTGYDWLALKNHSVVKIEKSDIPEDVGCLQVENTHNFAILAGIFVHNCDGAAGAYFNAITDDIVISSQHPSQPTLFTDSFVSEEEPPPVTMDIDRASRAGKGKSFDA